MEITLAALLLGFAVWAVYLVLKYSISKWEQVVLLDIIIIKGSWLVQDEDIMYGCGGVGLCVIL